MPRTSVFALCLTLLACASQPPPPRVTIEVRTSGEYRPATPLPVLVGGGDSVGCTLGTMFGAHFDLVTQGDSSQRFLLRSVWSHPPIQYPGEAFPRVLLEEERTFTLPLGNGPGTMLIWAIAAPHEQVPGPYELRLLGPDGRVLHRSQFIVSGCPSPA